MFVGESNDLFTDIGFNALAESRVKPDYISWSDFRGVLDFSVYFKLDLRPLFVVLSHS